MIRASSTLGELAARAPRRRRSRARMTREQRAEISRENLALAVAVLAAAPPEQKRAREMHRVQRRGHGPVFITWRGETLWQPEWAERLGIRLETFRSRYKAHLRDPQTWPLDRVMTEPVARVGKLSHDQAAQLRADRDAGMTYGQLVRKYGVTKSSVQQILAGVVHK